MNQPHKPSYPRITLKQAIGLASKIYRLHRTDSIERETAARSMGYAGLTGRGIRVLSDLNQFDLLSGPAEGQVQLTHTALDILHGDEQQRNVALLKAACAPAAFGMLHQRFPEGPASAGVARSFLAERGADLSVAGPAAAAYMDVCHYLESIVGSGDAGEAAAVDAVNAGDRNARGERVVFREETGEGCYLKIVAAGEIDEALLAALDAYVDRQRARLEARPEVARAG